jgi:peptidoglycan hydrolase-like protein with peptidoglycan-binding domain
MRYSVILLLALVLSAAPNAQAASVTESLARMDAIIKEMQTLRNEFARLSTAAEVPSVPKPQSGTVLGAQSKSFFTQSLDAGETNSDIKKIQKLLATDPEIYPYGVTSGFFGPKTEEGIKNFQTRFSLDPVGVVGPATKDLFELFFSAYPDDIYPQDVLKKKPSVPAVRETAVPVSQPLPPAPTVTDTTPSTVAVKEMVAKYDGESADVQIVYAGGKKEKISVDGSSKLKIIDAVALATGLKKATVLGVIEFVSATNRDDEDDEDEDEDEDESDEIESITASVEDGEARIEVEYENGDDEDFTVEETKEAQIIKEVADELNIDEDDVEDVIEFEFQDVDEINVEISDGRAIATVEFEDGTTKRIKISSEDEDEIIEAIADELDEDEDDVEEWTNF